MSITSAQLRALGVHTAAGPRAKRSVAIRLDRYKSELERDYGRRLALLHRAGEIRWWKYEPIKLRLADGCWFTPDFAVITAAGEMELHETKGGFMREAARVRLRVAAESFPFVARFVLVRRIGRQWNFEQIGFANEV